MAWLIGATEIPAPVQVQYTLERIIRELISVGGRIRCDLAMPTNHHKIALMWEDLTPTEFTNLMTQLDALALDMDVLTNSKSETYNVVLDIANPVQVQALQGWVNGVGPIVYSVRAQLIEGAENL